jgi:hypothetical protein
MLIALPTIVLPESSTSWAGLSVGRPRSLAGQGSIARGERSFPRERLTATNGRNSVKGGCDEVGSGLIHAKHPEGRFTANESRPFFILGLESSYKFSPVMLHEEVLP